MPVCCVCDKQKDRNEDKVSSLLGHLKFKYKRKIRARCDGLLCVYAKVNGKNYMRACSLVCLHKICVPGCCPGQLLLLLRAPRHQNIEKKYRFWLEAANFLKCLKR